jgi:hypothetical protein
MTSLLTRSDPASCAAVADKSVALLLPLAAAESLLGLDSMRFGNEEKDT